MPAGWYPDPSSPGWLRWWDGLAWTAHVSAPPPVAWADVADPQRDLATELSTAKWARIAMYAFAAAYFLEALVIAILASPLAHDVKKSINQANNDPNMVPNPFRGHEGTLVAAIVGIDGLSVVGLAAEVTIVVWLFNAMTFARRLGIPARRSPVWAILGFIVPVVSFWFPYVCVVDLLEPDDRRRRLAGWWWACWSFAPILIWSVAVVSWFSIPAAVLVALIIAIVPFAGARFGAAMIAVSGEAHRARLAAQSTGL
jgi:hypothetical protein